MGVIVHCNDSKQAFEVAKKCRLIFVTVELNCFGGEMYEVIGYDRKGEPCNEVYADLFIRTNGMCEEPKGHPHAELMALYAQDAAEIDRPWERWERRGRHYTDTWYQLTGHPEWRAGTEYRRNPRVLNSFSDACKAIAESGTTFEQALHNPVLMGDGAVLPQPALEAKELDDLRTYFVVNLASDGGYADNHGRWEGGPYEYELLKRGLIHQTEEDAKAWAEYLLKLTSVI